MSFSGKGGGVRHIVSTAVEVGSLFIAGAQFVSGSQDVSARIVALSCGLRRLCEYGISALAASLRQLCMHFRHTAAYAVQGDQLSPAHAARLAASRYFDGRWMTKFRGHYCVDGGVMAFIPTVHEADYTVKVRARGGADEQRMHNMPCRVQQRGASYWQKTPAV